MEHLATLLADIGGSRDSRTRDDKHSTAQQPEGSSPRDVKDDRRSRARGNSTSASASASIREPSRSVRHTNRESRDYRDHRDREWKETKDSKESRDAKDVKDSKHWHQEMDPSPPPYQEIADVNIPRPIHAQNDSKTSHDANDDYDDDLPPVHPSGITPTERCVKDAISVPVDWVIHPSAPHFLICGRCFVDRIYETHQWRREFVKYSPSTGLSLRCHLGAIPHMAPRWSKVHTADEFLAFLKVMQRKKVSKPCPGHLFPSSTVGWYTTPSIPGIYFCPECRQSLLGGTIFSKYLASVSSDAPPTFSICHGSLNHTKRMVDILLEDDDWDHFVERMRLRIQLSGCSSQREPDTDDEVGRWYRYSKSGNSRDLHICEACYLDHVYKTNTKSDFVLAGGLSSKPRCMASLRENLTPETADVEYGRAEVMRVVHGADRRCYAQGTVGLRWYTTPSNPRSYGICEGCYLAKIGPQGDDLQYWIPKKDIGKKAAFACWMNSYHPCFKRHQQVVTEMLTLGDIGPLERSIKKFSRMPGCQEGGMGQGKNKRWWGWKDLRICVTCVKGGGLAETPAGKKFELHGEKDPYHRFCGLYSMKLRDLFYHEDVGQLLEFARKRQELLA